MATIRFFTVNSILKNVLTHRFSLLTTRHDKILFVIITSGFSLLFMDVFIPFNINSWYDLSRVSLFNIISAFSFCGALTLLFTQFGLRKWLHMNRFSYMQYFFWAIGEVMLLSIVMLAIDWLLNKHPVISVNYYLLTFKYTLLIAIVPYVVSLLILFARQKSQLARNLSKMNMTKPLSAYLSIEDENGKVILSLQLKNILFFKSEDNYVDVHYLLGGKVKKELIRTTLKRIESKCSCSCLIRVHRSYTINIENVSSSRKTTKGYILQFDLLPDLQIPVSASHQNQFEQYLVNTDIISPFTPL
ncbi:transcriptional regulator, LytTR family [Mucilaginibacter mallensis]|uniref:Transcriptional regulator, LytTR family n=1 Tax=Mucilaginibacter mallensis TaxID=652787 RepID=A0A1H1W7B0_MUCMA|nr:LytTR family DNA-binding domain-containing protein [Mucilaginibacter mallensis]SDS92541.1 transcriptional regulator, LytTR family [Mucilaginibacter mallensis]